MAQCHVVRPTIFDAFQIALCMDDVSVHLPFILAFPAIENAHLKCLESQFRFVCPHFGSINNNCALRYCHTWQRYIVHVIVTKFMYCISIVVTLVPLCRCTSKFISFSDSLPNSDTFCASFAPFQILCALQKHAESLTGNHKYTARSRFSHDRTSLRAFWPWNFVEEFRIGHQNSAGESIIFPFGPP